MKRLSVLALAAIFACGAYAHGSSQSLTPATAAISTSQTSAFAGNGGGVSISGAANHQTATTGGTSGGSAGTALFGTTKYANVGVSGIAATSGLSAAGNLSIGNASGAASASGVGMASIVGSGEAHTVANGPQANVSGNAESITGTAAASGSNGLAISGGTSVAAFDAGASARQIKVGPVNHIDVSSHGISTGGTAPTVGVTLGTGTIQLQTEAAANAFGQARVGSISQ
jgi:hypothetical protein